MSQDLKGMVKKGDLLYFQFENLSVHSEVITHCFTTRKGGVSEGCYSSLNLGVNKKGEAKENVIENFKIISSALNLDYKDMVLSNQIHDDRIKYVTEADRGKGIVRESDIIGYDALITDRRQVPLATFYADCVPVFFFDPVRCVIALAHSGWRGTLREIAPKTLKCLITEHACRAQDVKAVIGPSIGLCCFEVGEEVYREFANKFPYISEYSSKTSESHWHIDLRGIIRTGLENTGMKSQNISVSDICTKCNKDLFFSHRGDNGNTGVMAAIMSII